MTKKKRTIITIVFVEVLLAGLWAYLANKGLWNPNSVTPDFQATLGRTMGTAMGAFAGLGVLLVMIAAKNDAATKAKTKPV